MNETLFTFPAESGSSTGGDKLFDLSGLTQADGDASENPFAAMLAEVEAAGQKEDADLNPSLELISGGSQTQQAETETENNTAHDKDAQQVKTPPTSQEDAEELAEITQEAPEENPLMAAINRQEERNAQKAAEPIFAQLPVFSYNGTEEFIENLEQTFEELRLAKADDFPEFDEAQSLSWSVSYGKFTKAVTQPILALVFVSVVIAVTGGIRLLLKRRGRKRERSQAGGSSGVWSNPALWMLLAFDTVYLVVASFTHR